MIVLVCVGIMTAIATSAFNIRTPTATKHVPRSPDEVAGCLSAAGSGYVAVRQLETGGTQVDVLNGKRASIETFVIYPEKSGSRVDISRQLFAIGSTDWKSCLR